jgi:site-specific DNA-methyltransferase (adenine-specific)
MRYPDDFIDQVILGDSLEVLKEIPDNSIDTIITDPPYGLEFMGKEWDSFGSDLQKYQEWTRQWASEVLRVAKPGAIMLAFGGTRTFHRMGCGIEDAGWEIRDTLMWIYGQGFPKSLNIGKEVDKLQGNEREVVGKIDTKRLEHMYRVRVEQGYRPNIAHASGIRTKGFSEWEGYGTALKPAYEPIIMAMKPIDGTFAENALKWGVAGLNINEARIEIDKRKEIDKRCVTGINNISRGKHNGGVAIAPDGNNYPMYKEGRFPANVLLDEVSAEMLDEQSDGVSRFFYVAKASKSERDAGLEEREQQDVKVTNYYGLPRDNGSIREIPQRRNNHPTVKPIKLIDYLVKLTKMPNPNQIYLDPFLGSGTTAIAVVLNGRHFIGIEKEPEYVEIAKKRIEYWGKKAKNEMF